MWPSTCLGDVSPVLRRPTFVSPRVASVRLHLLSPCRLVRSKHIQKKNAQVHCAMLCSHKATNYQADENNQWSFIMFMSAQRTSTRTTEQSRSAKQRGVA